MIASLKHKSPVVRRELASLLQRLPLDKRTDIAKALLQRKEDENDPNIPLLVWYGIEPVVAADPKAGMMLANASKWDKITGFIYRRMSSDDAGRSALLSFAADMPDAAQREKVVSMVTENARRRTRFELPADWGLMAEKLGKGTSRTLALNLTELESLAGKREATAAFFKILQNESEAPAVRQQALNVVLNAHPPEMLPDLVTMAMTEAVPVSAAPRHHSRPGPLSEKREGVRHSHGRGAAADPGKEPLRRGTAGCDRDADDLARGGAKRS